MIDCFSCGAKFKASFEEEEMDVRYCPHCGEELIEELDLTSDLTDFDYVLEEDD